MSVAFAPLMVRLELIHFCPLDNGYDDVKDDLAHEPVIRMNHAHHLLIRDKYERHESKNACFCSFVRCLFHKTTNPHNRVARPV